MHSFGVTLVIAGTPGDMLTPGENGLGERESVSGLCHKLKKKRRGAGEDSWISGQTVSPLRKGTARLPLILCFFHVLDSGRAATIGRL